MVTDTSTTYRTKFLGLIGITSLTVTGHAEVQAQPRRLRSCPMRIRARLVGLLAATVILLVILIGLPMVLLALGPAPSPLLPSLEQIRTAFTTPDDGTLAWAHPIALVRLARPGGQHPAELGARLRGLHAPRCPACRSRKGQPQLVTAAALLFVIAPAALAQAQPAVHRRDSPPCPRQRLLRRSPACRARRPRLPPAPTRSGR